MKAPICGAKTRSGSPCKKPGGWATDHVGTGRCKLHGGASPGGPLKHGRYSIKRAGLEEKIRQFENDPAAGDLTSELALMRALLQNYLERFEDGIPLPADSIRHIFEMIEAVGRLVERIAKILATTALTQAELQLLQAALIHALPEYIPEPAQQRNFISAIFGESARLLETDTR
jgi:hypothetical protein